MMGMSGRLSGHDASDYRVRFRRLFALVLTAFAVLIVRMAYLQVIKGDEYKLRSESNSVRLRKIKPFRGLILDSRRQVLVDAAPLAGVVAHRHALARGMERAVAPGQRVHMIVEQLVPAPLRFQHQRKSGIT